MVSAEEMKKVNCQLSQLYNILKNYLDRIYFQNILDKINNINHQIRVSSYLELHDSALIGDTILHLAAKENAFEYFNIILKYGANFTILNKNGLTAIHEIIQQCDPLKAILNNRFINSILDAQIRMEICTNPCDKNGISHFHAACMTNNAKAVEYFLLNGVPIDQSINVDSSILPGYTPLHIAVKLCALETVEMLLKYRADVQIKDAKGQTPLDALLEQKLEILDSLIAETEANICIYQHSRRYCYHRQKEKWDSQVNFYDSASEDSKVIEKIARLFLEYYVTNGRFASIDDNFVTYLNIACTMNDNTMLDLLLEKVADVNYCISRNSTVCLGYTALHFAALFNINAVKSLLKKGADIEVTDSNGKTPFDICLEKYEIEDIHSIVSIVPAWKNIVLSDGQTKLTDFIYAMREVNHFNSFVKNVCKNINLQIPNDSLLWPGFTPLHIAVVFNKRIRNLHCSTELKIKYFELIKNCLDKGAKIIAQDANGWTAVHLAFRLNIDVIDSLLQNHYLCVNPTDNDGLSYLHIACLTGHQALAENLLLNGENVNATVKSTIRYETRQKSLLHDEKPLMRYVNAGSTPLHNAVSSGSPEIANLLLQYGGDPYAKDIYGMTPIHHEVINPVSDMKGNSILRLLPKVKDCIAVGQLSHLHVASYVNELNVVEKLLNLGSNINAKMTYQSDNCDDTNDPLYFLKKYEGFTALNFALMNSTKKITELLLQRGADVLVINNGSTPLFDILKGTRSNAEVFIKALRRDAVTQNRMEKYSGVTMLHVACNRIDAALVKQLLNSGADVNKRANLDSPIWPGCTPLHCLLNASNKGMFGGSFSDSASGILRLLLDHGAEVTLPNAEFDTPLHLAYKVFCEYRGKLDIFTMMKALKNFDVNPINRVGISHFHIACCVNDAALVGKFVEYNQSLDVNEPIDYFCKEFSGCTPLHLAVNSAIKHTLEISSQLETINLLLDYGADVNAEDSWGNTPLHAAAKSDLSSVDLLEIIILGGADLRAKNILEETPLEILLKSKKSKDEEIELFFRHGLQANDYTSSNEEGYIAITFSRRYHEKFQKSIFDAMMKTSDLISVDEKGRTVIHNIVSIGSPIISDIDYVDLLENLSNSGCDINSQDKSGCTALHIAVQFRNYDAVAGLLKAGADPNILDTNEKLAFAYIFEPSRQAKHEEDHNFTSIIMRILAVHVHRLQLCGLDVHPLNISLKIEAFEKIALEINIDNIKDCFDSEVKKSKNVEIGSDNLTLYDLLSETGAVAAYPTMTFVERNALNKYFESSHKHKLYGEFIELACLLKLQYRKAVSRLLLVEPAKESLQIATGFDLPKLCSDAILRFLKNIDLINLINATNSGS